MGRERRERINEKCQSKQGALCGREQQITLGLEGEWRGGGAEERWRGKGEYVG